MTHIKILLYLMIVGSCFAQSRKVGAYFYTMDYADQDREILLPSSKDDYEKISLSTANIYGPYKTTLTKENKLFLCDKNPLPIDQQKDAPFTHPIIANIQIPSNIKEPLIILIPSKKSMKYEALVVERSVTDFPMGSYRMINFTNRNIRGMVGNTKVQIKPWKQAFFNPTKDSDNSNRYKVIFQFEENERWQTFGATTWTKRLNKRTLLFSYISPDNGKMKIRAIPIREQLVYKEKPEGDNI